MGYQLGIDLGTTYTAAAVCRGSGRHWVEPEVITLGTRTATVPSVLFLGPDGAVVVGEAAERRALTDPDRVVREFKRRVGDPTPVVVAGRAWAAEELSARLVRWVVDRVAEREGGPAARIAVTHPAAWGAHKKELLAAALAGQGLAVTFLAEPQAAALHYAGAERVEPGSTIAVYDLGGGTFDAAVVRKAPAGAAAEGGGFGLLGRPEGVERLGGVDFDEAVFEHVRAGLPAAFEGLDEADPAVLAAVARVRRECTEAKEALSADTEVAVPVLLPGSRGSVRLHRSEFEQLIRPQVEETVAALRRAVGSAGLTPEQLSAVLLVGGSSRIPLVAQLVSEQLARPVAVDADPKNAIAKGAALAVSPKPTESWPGVSIAPVAAVGAAAPAGGALAAPPVSTPGTPPQGMSVPGGPEPLPAWGAMPPSQPPMYPEPSARPATALMSPSGPQPERPPMYPDIPAQPPTALISPSGPQPARPPVHRPSAPGWEHDDQPEQRKHRPVGLLVGAGGVLAVAAVLVAVLAWPTATPTTTSGTSTGTTVETIPTEAAPAMTPEPTVPANAADPVSAPPGAGNDYRAPSGSGTANGNWRPTGRPGTGTGAGVGSGGGGAPVVPNPQPSPQPQPQPQPLPQPQPDPQPQPQPQPQPDPQPQPQPDPQPQPQPDPQPQPNPQPSPGTPTAEGTATATVPPPA